MGDKTAQVLEMGGVPGPASQTSLGEAKILVICLEMELIG